MTSTIPTDFTTDRRYWGPFAELMRSAGERVREIAAYHGVMAELSDRMLADTSDLAQYATIAARTGGPVLELGCGTGRVMVPLLREGFEVVGVDLAPDMLRVAHDRIAALDEAARARASLVRADIATMELERELPSVAGRGNGFPLIILPYVSIQLFTSAALRRDVIRTAARHLAPGGVFAFDYMTFDFDRRADWDGALVSLDLELGGTPADVLLGVKLDEENGLLVENCAVSLRNADSADERLMEVKRLAMLDAEEIEALLWSEGLVIVDRVTTTLPGAPAARTLLSCRRRNDTTYPLWHPYLPNNGMAERVLNLVSGEGCTVTDDAGRSYLDASSGLWSTQCGLGEKRIIDAVRDQLDALSYGTLFAARGNPAALALARRLVELAPPPLDQVYLTGSGSESVELALKLARLYWHQKGQPEKTTIAYLDQSYHGTFFGSMGVTGLVAGKERLGPQLPGLAAIDAPNPDRCPPGMPEEQYAIECADQLAHLAQNTDGGVAALIIEPILGSAGVMIPHQAYFDRLRRICREHEILLLVDEVATGFGRTGAWFASEHFRLRPDVMLLSKGLSNGYLPLGAVLFSAEIGEAFLRAGVGLAHGSSHNGNPACCAAALATIDVIVEDDLVLAASWKGRHLLDELYGALDGIESVAEIRGLGLMAAVALRQVDGTVATPVQVSGVYELLKRAGVLAYPGLGAITLIPPLTISREQLSTIAAALAGVLAGVRLVDGDLRTGGGDRNARGGDRGTSGGVA